MKAVTKILAGGIGLAALAGAAPAAAQYYPNYPNQGYGNSGLGAIIDAILGAQRGYGQQGYGYGYNQHRERALIEQCARATEVRLQRSYASYNRYGGQYGYGGYANASPARIVNITNIQRRSNGSLRIYGTATSGQMSGYGQYGSQYGGQYGGQYGSPYGGYQGGYNAAYAADLQFNCSVNNRGRVTDVNINRLRYRHR